MRFSLPLLVPSIAASLALAGCSSATPADTMGSGEAESLAPAATSTIVSCADTDDPSMHASLEVDASYRFTWKIGDMEAASSTLTDVAMNVQDDSTSYSFHLASGEYISLDMGKESTSVGFSALYALCAPKTAVDENAIAPLLAATKASVAHKQDFAKCSFSGDGAEVPEQDTFTVRPSLDGHGAIFEDDATGNSDQSFVLLARRLVANAGSQSSIYSGEGGVAVFAAGQHVSSLTELTFTNSSPATVQWDWQEKLPSSSCDVTGAAYASSLLR